MSDNLAAASETRMISLEELKGYTFVIPSYQRGFRWSWRNIKDLVDDLVDFALDGSREVYCLQPIVVKKIKEKEYEVIDGQQRLTAIWILSKLHYALKRDDPSIYNNTYVSVNYKLSYLDKESYQKYITNLNEFFSNIDNIEDHNFTKPSVLLEALMNYDIPDDIDSKCLWNIINYLLSIDSQGKFLYRRTIHYDAGWSSEFSFAEVAKDFIFNRYGKNKLGQPILKPIQFIWQELTNSDSDTTAIEKFTNINANRIPLTNAELAKAYFIKALGDTRETEFTLQWEAIDRALSRDNFWYFISSNRENEEKVQTRIDLLLRIWLHSKKNKEKPDDHSKVIKEKPDDHSKVIKEKPDDHYFISREIDNALKKCNEKHKPIDVWKEIVAIYDTLCDWHEDYVSYHLIGLLIEVSDRSKVSSGELIYILYDKYNGSKKDFFRDDLKEEIRKAMNFLFKEEENGNKITVDESTINERLGSLSYNDQTKEYIKPALLCFNIALLVSGYIDNPQNSAERFPFDFYKRGTSKNDQGKTIPNPIEIEHINPQHLEGKDSDNKDYTPKNKHDWALDTLDIIPDSDELLEKINSLKKNDEDFVEDFEEKFRSLATEIEEKAEIHSFANLTLLDKSLNTSYGDKFFDDKRKHIIAARFGLDAPKKHSNSVILPGTMWVFMRQYVDSSSADNNKSDSSDTQKDVSINNRWTSKDKEKYLNSISSYIYKLLLDGEQTEGKKKEEVNSNGE